MKLRRILKRAAFSLCAIVVGPLIVLARLERAVSAGEGSFTACADGLSLVPGTFGNFLRLAFYRFTLQRCSLDVCFNFGATVNHPTAEIGANVSIGGYASIGTATIGDDVLIGPRVSILSGRHQHSTASGAGELNAGLPVFERVRIGSHSWIGERATIAADVGERCIVAAGAVVLRPMGNDKLVVGNPARAMSREFCDPSAMMAELSTSHRD